MNKMEKITKDGKRKKPFWGKPNWFAAVLVAMLLVGGWGYLGSDLTFYCQACHERAVLAGSAEKAILDAPDTTPIDMGWVEEEADKVNHKIQTLADNTDLGEALAANDLTTEGREANKALMCTIFAMFAIAAIYLLMQCIHVLVLIVKACGKKNNNSKQGGAAA